MSYLYQDIVDALSPTEWRTAIEICENIAGNTGQFEGHIPLQTVEEYLGILTTSRTVARRMREERRGPLISITNEYKLPLTRDRPIPLPEHPTHLIVRGYKLEERLVA